MEPASRPRIKICCIASRAEARLAIDSGASALGLVGAMPSGPGVIPDDVIAEIALGVPPPIATFLLTSEQSTDGIVAHHRRARTTAIQLVDRLKRGTYADLRRELPGTKLVQVLHVTGPESVEEAVALAGDVDALLLDSGRPDMPVKELGGTGRRHDWHISRRIREELEIPVFLAGGLHAGNVREAIDLVGPFGLDVCSGVRTGGLLDPSRLLSFFKAAGFALLLLINAVCSPAALRGQIRGVVKGTVMDAETGAPLENTNVYLSSTTIGTNTGRDGKYLLTNIPPGVFQVVASRVGHRLASALIHVSQAETLRTDFRLEPVTLQVEEVQVLAHADKEWHRFLEDFRKAFFGDGENSPECTLLNPEVLDFRMEQGTSILIASTDSVLRIENRALGYKLYARLGVFEWDMDDDRGRFVLYPRFEPFTPGDSTGTTHWRSNRIRSYRGSLKHFLASLVAGTMEKEGFLVSSGTLTDLQGGAFHLLSPDDFTLLPVPGQPFWRLTFENWLRVDYRSEQARSRSYIGLSGITAILDGAGNLVDPLSVNVIGDWTKYRVADMLPLE